MIGRFARRDGHEDSTRALSRLPRPGRNLSRAPACLGPEAAHKDRLPGAPDRGRGPDRARHVNGFEMYLDETGGQIAGRKVEVIVEDTAGNPATAITKMRKLVESDRVHMVVGETFAHIGYAL